MEVKFDDLVNLNKESLEILNKLPVPIHLCDKLLDIFKLFQSKVENFKKIHDDIRSRWIKKDKDGKEMYGPNGTYIFDSKENEDSFKRELDELLNTTFEIQIDKIKIGSDYRISMDQFKRLKFLLET